MIYPVTQVIALTVVALAVLSLLGCTTTAPQARYSCENAYEVAIASCDGTHADCLNKRQVDPTLTCLGEAYQATECRDEAHINREACWRLLSE